MRCTGTCRMQRKLAEERKARSDTEGRWQHDRFGVEVPDDEARKVSCN